MVALHEAVVVILTPMGPIVERIEAAVKAAAGRAVIVEDVPALMAVVDQEDPLLILINQAAPGEWQSAIRRSKLLPQTRQIPIHIFSDHLPDHNTNQNDALSLHLVNENYVDKLWEQEHLLVELPQLVEQQLRPVTIYPDGWDDHLSDQARLGLEEFNRRDYFEQHEYLEAAWMAEERPIRELYQGILQVGVAFLQIERNNWRGAVKMFRRGLPKLRALPERCQGIDLAAFRATAEQIHAEVSMLGAARLADFDQTRFPQIRYE